jgi:CheY-like chemotaxis protein
MPTKDPARALAGVYILVVEDDDDSRTILTTVLRYYGAHVSATTSAEAALEQLKILRPHVIVTDIAMPRYDGLWLLRQVRALVPGDEVSVIAVTAVAEPDELLAAGFHAALTKPVDPRALCHAIRRLLGFDD